VFAADSVDTITVTNNGSSYYLLDGVVKPIVTFVPGTTYRFNTSGVVGSHPFRFSLTANGPTEYTYGVTVGTGYTEINVDYATSSSLFYYCTNHSGMGNTANTLRSENLITAAQTGSMSVLSSSYASTASVAISASFATTASAATSITFTPSTASFAVTASFATNATIPAGTVSSSGQIDYNSITNKLSGTISASAQFNALSGTSASYANTASAATSITFIPQTASFASTVNLDTITGTTFSNAAFYFPQDVRVEGTLTAQQIFQNYAVNLVLTPGQIINSSNSSSRTTTWSVTVSPTPLPAGTVVNMSLLFNVLLKNREFYNKILLDFFNKLLKK
jgi:hypothetical protein